MSLFIQILHIVTAILLVVVIVAQEKSSGLSAAIGGANMSFHSKKRGPEKVLHYMTVVLAVLFLATAILSIFA
jgi:protein translocase SecG subunit